MNGPKGKGSWEEPTGEFPGPQCLTAALTHLGMEWIIVPHIVELRLQRVLHDCFIYRVPRLISGAQGVQWIWSAGYGCEFIPTTC